MTALNKLIDPKPSHIIKAEQMADSIYSEPNSVHMEMLEAIKKRLIGHSEIMLQKLKKH